MAEYNIYISNKNKSKVLKLPIVPKEFPTITKTIENEEFKSYSNGSYNNIKSIGLDTFTLECWLPIKKYIFSKSEVVAYDVISLINNAIENKEYINVTIIANGQSYINNKYSIEAWAYGVNYTGDYEYSLGLKQYREFSNINYILGWNKNANGWWYCYDIANYKWYADEWQNINSNWYYFNGDGYAISSQWLLWKNIWYYFDDECKMIHNQWLQINGKWYYFFDSGEMAKNTTVEGYPIGDNGAWRE